MRSAFLRELARIGVADERVVVMTGDLGFKIFDECRAVLGDRFINAGVAEANLVGVAAGLALGGRQVYCYSIAPFLTMRAYEQIRIDVCAHNLPVRIIGVGGALAYALEGVSHHSLEDVALMRAIPTMSVVVPADAVESAALARATATYPGPVYVRLAKDEPIVVHPEPLELAIGGSVVLREPDRVTVLVNGPLLAGTVEACAAFPEIGLVSMPSVKPLDLPLIRRIAATAEVVVTVEEHSSVGGFGSAVTDALVESDYTGRIRRFALPDAFFEAIGGRDYLRGKVGLDPKSLCERLEKIVHERALRAA